MSLTNTIEPEQLAVELMEADKQTLQHVIFILVEAIAMYVDSEQLQGDIYQDVLNKVKESQDESSV